VISLAGRRQHWVAQFAKEEDAAVAYDRVALGLLGNEAKRNFPRRRLRPATVEEIREWASSLSGYRRKSG
jgi:hypothetical protein